METLQPFNSRTPIDQKSYKENRELLPRISTYANFPSTGGFKPKPYRLAKAGFYFTEIRDQIRCHFCGLVVGDLHLVYIDILALHRRFSPNCEYAAETERQEKAEYEDDDDAATDTNEPQEENYNDVDLAENSKKIKDAKSLLRKRSTEDGIETLQMMKEENDQIELQLKCKNCKRERLQILFLPCRHLVSCEPCADQVDFCFYCNSKIMGTVRSFVV